MTRETSISMDHASRMDHKCTRSAGLNMNPDRRAHRSGPRRGPDHIDIPHDRGPGRGTADRARRQNAQHSQCAHRTRGYPRGRGATQPDMCNTTRPSLARDRQEQHSTHDLTLATSPPEDKHRGAHTSPRRQPTPSDVHVSQYMLPHTCRPMSMHHVLRPMCHVHAHVLFRAPALHILCAPPCAPLLRISLTPNGRHQLGGEPCAHGLTCGGSPPAPWPAPRRHRPSPGRSQALRAPSPPPRSQSARVWQAPPPSPPRAARRSTAARRPRSGPPRPWPGRALCRGERVAAGGAG